MESEKFLPFMINYSIALIFIDAYFTISWRKFIKKNNYNKLLYKIPSLFSILMLLVIFYTIWIQIGNVIPSQFGKKLFALKSIWYLPKAGIVPILIIKDLYFIFAKRFKFRNINFIKLKNNLSKISSKLFINNYNPIPNVQLASNSNLNFTPENDDYLNFENENEVDKTFNNKKTTDKSKRNFLKNTSWALAGVPFVIITNGVLKTTYDFKIYNQEIFLNNLPKELDGLQILQISDIHAGSFISPNPIKEVVSIMNSMKSDLIFVTGDFVNFHPEEYNMIQNHFAKLKSDIGIYGCLGNHDHYMSENNVNKLRKKINNHGIKLLDNENIILNINNATLNIAGTDNTGYHQNFGDFNKALNNLSSDTSTILLSHDPTNWDRFIKNKKKVDLMLSGHTHGGQVGIEYKGEILSPARVAYNQFAGLYKENEQYLYINRGIGTTGPPVRVGVPPEITKIILRKKLSIV